MEQNLNQQEAANVAYAPEQENAVVNEENISGDLKQVSDEQKKAIQEKIAEIKREKKLKRVYAIVVFGDDEDEKPIYVDYFKRPDFSTSTTFSMPAANDPVKAANDPVQASRMLAQNCFVSGDKELVDDDDLFSFGLAAHISVLIQGRDGELVKGLSVGK